MNRRFAVRWLLVVAVMTGAFGLSMVIAPGPIQSFFNWMIFGEGNAPPGFTDEAIDYLRFVYGVLGAVMAGWMALTAAVVAGPLAQGERWAWNAVAASVAVWFALDTTHSLVTGYPENAAFNVAFFVALGAPLVAARPATA
jgi:hypothetical protein